MPKPLAIFTPIALGIATLLLAAIAGLLILLALAVDRKPVLRL